MKVILIALILTALSSCGAYQGGNSGNDAGQQSQSSTTGNGGGY
ncbi:MAG TPA: hypothetical protein VIP51_11540 [Eoetvoesiella sp.]